MKIDLSSIVSMNEINTHFSVAIEAVQTKGAVVIIDENKPKYILIDYEKFIAESPGNDTPEEAALFIIKNKISLLKELANENNR